LRLGGSFPARNDAALNAALRVDLGPIRVIEMQCRAMEREPHFRSCSLRAESGSRGGHWDSNPPNTRLAGP